MYPYVGFLFIPFISAYGLSGLVISSETRCVVNQILDKFRLRGFFPYSRVEPCQRPETRLGSLNAQLQFQESVIAVDGRYRNIRKRGKINIQHSVECLPYIQNKRISTFSFLRAFTSSFYIIVVDANTGNR